jgi:hypothetical protein
MDLLDMLCGLESSCSGSESGQALVNAVMYGLHRNLGS